MNLQPFLPLLSLLSLPRFIAYMYLNQDLPSPSIMPDDLKKQIHPEDLRLYSLALKHRWSKREVYHEIAPNVPMFVYCPLMLPWVLAKVLGLQGIEGTEETATHMTRATLRHHFRTMIKYEDRPTIVHSKKETAVDGILIAGLQNKAYAGIEEYIGPEQHSKEIEEVEIELANDEKLIVAAHVYVWNESVSLLEATHWTPLDFMRRPTYQLEDEDRK